MHIVNQLDEKIWKSFVQDHPQGNVFHTPEMAEVYRRAAGHRPRLWAALDSAGDVQALFAPVEVAVMNGLLRPLTTRSVAYGSLLCAPGPQGQAALRLLLQTYQREMKPRALFTELRNLADLAPLQPDLGELGFAFEDHLNFLIDLSRPLPELWDGIRSNARRNIKKAGRSGVEVVELEQAAGIPVAYGILSEVYRRIQVPLPDLSLFQAAFDVLQPAGMLRLLVARLEGEDIGVLALLCFNGMVHYWYTGTKREYSAHRPGDLLVWRALQLGHECGYHTFDFGGGGRPDEEYGVRDFKAKFGGQLVNHGRNVWVHAPLRLRLSQAGYQVMRRFL